MNLLRQQIGTFCTDPDEIQAHSLLAFCLSIGHHFLAAEHDGRTPVQVRAHAAGIILNDPDQS